MIRAIACCLLLGVASLCSAAQPNEFRFRKDIELHDAGAASIAAAVLDRDVYAATRDAYPDLRIFDAKNQETPFVLEKATETLTQLIRGDCRSRVLSLRELGDGLEVIVGLKKDEPSARGLTIVTPLSNYERRVQVFGSQDGKIWRPLVNDGLVFDYSRYMDVNNREIHLPKNDCRQFKVLISAFADTKESPFLDLTRKYSGGVESERIEKTTLERRPFRMDRIDLWTNKEAPLVETDKKVAYPVAMLRVEEKSEDKTTIVHVKTHREPLTEFTLELTSRNFNRAVRIQTPVTRGTHTQWIDIANGRASLLQFGQFRRESLTIPIPESRQTEFRIVIQNEDNPPLAITGIKARGNQYRTIFLTEENRSYSLYYGSEEVASPKYDAAEVLGSLRLRGNRPSDVQLGEQIANAMSPPSPPNDIRHLLNNPLFMGAVIATLVVVLGWALFRATRRINDIPKD
jgi:hypothetical protein